MSQRAASMADLTTWRSRAAVELTNGIVQATLLPGGGHVAAFHFLAGHGKRSDNVLWEAPWPTFDPGTPEHARFAEEHGDLGAGRFLASFTGHALCLDGFGPPTSDELAAGASLHGEASASMWSFASQGDMSTQGVADLPLAALRVRRDFSLLQGESVLRVAERLENLSDVDRLVHWVEHATVGPPMFGGTTARVTASVDAAITWPYEYEGVRLLAQYREFTWPWAPLPNNDALDLRDLFAQSNGGFVAAARQIRGREHGFVAVTSAELGLAMGYIFSAAVFPWVTFWEENQARQGPPWGGTVQARGLEFGTTPLPLGNEAVDRRGKVFHTPTSLKLGPHQTQRAPWLLFVGEIPSNWREVEDVRAEADCIVLCHGSEEVRLVAAGAATFLSASRESDRQEVAPCEL